MSQIYINYIKPAKRFSPEPFLFLSGIILTFVKNWKEAIYSKKDKDKVSVSQNTSEMDSIIAASSKEIDLDLIKIEDWGSLSQVTQIAAVNILNGFENVKNDDSHKLAVFYLSLFQIREYLLVYTNYEVGFTPIFIQTMNLMKELESISVLPTKFFSLIESIKKLCERSVTEASKKRTYLHIYEVPPKPLPEYTPDIKMDLGKKLKAREESKETREGNEMKRLKRKLKGERKGAERELRLDAKFIARKRTEEKKRETL